jgi:hypothetical protein
MVMLEVRRGRSKLPLSLVLVGDAGCAETLAMSAADAEGLRRACCAGNSGPDTAPGGSEENA